MLHATRAPVELVPHVGRHEAHPECGIGPRQLDGSLVAVDGLAAQEVGEQAAGSAEVRDGMGHVGERCRLGAGGGEPGRRRRLPACARRLRELHNHATRLGGVEERLLPRAVRHVDTDGVEPRVAHGVQRAREVGHLVGEVVRAGAVAVEVPPEEVVVLDAMRRDELELGAVGEPKLRRREPGPLAPRCPLSSEVDGIARPRVRPPLDGERHVVERRARDAG